MSDVRPEFATHVLTDDAARDIADVRAEFSTLLAKMGGLVPLGREFSLMVTNLQQACMWAVHGIAGKADKV